MIDLEAALAGSNAAEIGRIPTQIGPWGIATSPNGRWVVAANRESQKVAFEGNTISIIDVEHRRPVRRRHGCWSAPATPTSRRGRSSPRSRPDGQEIIVPNFRANNVSIVDLDMALSGDPRAEVARIPLTGRRSRRTRPARPKGSAVTSNGRYAVISGGPRADAFRTERHGVGHRPEARQVVATVTGVGNDPYGLAIVEKGDD